jgi:hypothetical protein
LTTTRHYDIIITQNTNATDGGKTMEEQLKFDWFEGGRPTAGEYGVTILKNGVINIRQGLFDEKLASYKFVKFGFNREKNVIAIKTVEEDAPGVYKLRTIKNGKNPSVSAHAFLKAYNIKHDESIRYKAEWDDENEMVLVDISKSQAK